MCVVLVGQPNVGKSSLLNLLCGHHALVSNYAGTTVECRVADLVLADRSWRILDTPGLYSMELATPETVVLKQALDRADAIINVVDATDLARHLPLTFELLQLDLPLFVCVNQLDRAHRLGMRLDLDQLAVQLGVPVVGSSAASGKGKREVLQALIRLPDQPYCRPALGEEGSSQSWEERWRRVEALTRQVVIRPRRTASLHREPWMRHPLLFTLGGLIGLTTCAALIAHGLDYSEALVGRALIPLYALLQMLSGWLGHSHQWPRYLVEGLVVPLGVVLPAMLLVYLGLALLEDSGLFDRFATLMHVPCRSVGLSGPCIIPLLLGTSCRVPGVLASRVIGNQRERWQTCALLAIAIPCAATLAVTGALIAAKGAQLVIVVGSALLAAGVISLLSRGYNSPLVLELSPVRLPSWRNVCQKTGSRMRSFFVSVLPLLVVCNALVRVWLNSGAASGLRGLDDFGYRWFGLDGTALAGLSVTVVQRYLAPLVLLSVDLSPRQATIACSMIVISFPCLPVALLCWRELGPRMALRIYALAILLPVLVGHGLHRWLP